LKEYKGDKMSILEKYSAALKNKDEAAMNELLHDDFKFTCINQEIL